jgi:DnaJ-class molecular chaperone
MMRVSQTPPQRARLLLGVAATSTREQIKAAYRRMASQCHPDRLREELRRQATDQMAEINEAYSLLCDCLREQAA